jgi:N-hydroxyarylamine O-acetyltransferase
MDRAAYLQRIGYHDSLEPTAETLRGLHRAHMLAVPFENLDIHLGRPIMLDEAAMFDKIVRRRRGGFCYELNGLFAALLRDLGYDVAMLAAGVARGDGSYGPEFDHLTLLVRGLDDGSRRPETSQTTSLSRTPYSPSPISWLADAGFGDSFREPLRFVEGIEQPQDGRAYRLDRAPDGEYWTMLQQDGAAWQSQYRFTLRPHAHAEYTEMCHYHQTSPQSSFTQRRICSRATPCGRVTLADMQLIITEDGERTEQALDGEEERRAVLHERFGIDLDL